MKNNKGRDNLIPINERPKEEIQEMGRKGGTASGETRRRRKQLKEDLIALLETNEWQERISLAILKKAASGDVKAYEVIRDTIGEKPKEEIEQKQEIKVVMDDEIKEWGN